MRGLERRIDALEARTAASDLSHLSDDELSRYLGCTLADLARSGVMVPGGLSLPETVNWLELELQST